MRDQLNNLWLINKLWLYKICNLWPAFCDCDCTQFDHKLYNIVILIYLISKIYLIIIYDLIFKILKQIS